MNARGPGTSGLGAGQMDYSVYKAKQTYFFLVRPSIPPAMAHDKLVLSRRPTPVELYSLSGSLSDSLTHSLMILPRHIFCQHLTKPRPPLPP